MTSAGNAALLGALCKWAPFMLFTHPILAPRAGEGYILDSAAANAVERHVTRGRTLQA